MSGNQFDFGRPPEQPGGAGPGYGPGNYDAGNYGPGNYSAGSSGLGSHGPDEHGAGNYGPTTYGPSNHGPGNYGPDGYGSSSYGGQLNPYGDPAPHTAFDDLNHPAPAVDPYVVVRTPIVWLASATALGLVAAVVAGLFGDRVGLAFTSWALAGPVAIGLLAVHALRDTALRTRLGYDRRSIATGLYAAAVGAAALGIGLSAFWIAVWAGRL